MGDVIGIFDVASEGCSDPPPLPPLPWINVAGWDGAPIPERRWSIRDRAPANQVGLFSGEGGTGKSIIELMKNVAHVTGKDWLGSMPEFGPTFYVGAEDDEDECHRRVASIASYYGVSFRDLSEGGFHIMSLLGKDATLCAVAGKSGRLSTTTLYKQIYEAAGDIKPRNISIDTLSRAFAGNEIDRNQVTAFASHMQALALVTDGGCVTVLSHPSLSGMASGSGISGSTAWHNSFRFRFYLRTPQDKDEEDSDIRELEFKKNQYGPKSETIALKWERGLFIPVASENELERAARDLRAQSVFMDLLHRYASQGRNVSHKKTSPAGYAPKLFAAEMPAKRAGLRATDFENAMLKLFELCKIRVEDYGKPSNPHYRITATDGV